MSSKTTTSAPPLALTLLLCAATCVGCGGDIPARYPAYPPRATQVVPAAASLAKPHANCWTPVAVRANGTQTVIIDVAISRVWVERGSSVVSVWQRVALFTDTDNRALKLLKNDRSLNASSVFAPLEPNQRPPIFIPGDAGSDAPVIVSLYCLCSETVNAGDVIDVVFRPSGYDAGLTPCQPNPPQRFIAGEYEHSLGPPSARSHAQHDPPRE